MKDIESFIGDLAVLALRAELDATVKPGLVDRLNSGAHKDMDYSLMSAGISAIAPWFREFARIGPEGFAKLKEAGIRAEAGMLKATGGVNTHKGAIFSLGLCAACAAGIIRAGERELSADNVCRLAAKTARGLGLSGASRARAEAEGGFATARLRGLPVLREALRTTSANDAHVQTLISLMSQTDDSNVLSRSNLSRAEALKLEAKGILESGGVFTHIGRGMIATLDKRLIAEGISPGGSADLLALCIFLNGLGGSLQSS